MHPDDLNRPLGLDAGSSAHPRREIPWGAIAFSGLAFLGAGIFAFARLTESGAADPVATMASLPQIQKPDAAAPPHPDVSMEDVTSSIEPPGRPNADRIEGSSGVRVVRSGGGGAPDALIISIPQQAGVSLAAAPDKRLVETGRFGPLPRIGADGSKPMDVYARPLMSSSKLPPGAPKIAILVGGMGLNAQATRSAIASLPAAVTLGFAPYGRNLAELAALAREKGHETILQAPMQGFGEESEEPGPHVLRSGAPEGEVINRLHWHMSRFQGYAGVAGFMGERFTADANAFGPVIREVLLRGLFYVDDGASPRSLAPKLAASAGAPFVRADVRLDANASAASEALDRLEKLAHQRGFAVGYANGGPAVVAKVAQFARRLETRGILLAPLSSLAASPDQATARAP